MMLADVNVNDTITLGSLIIGGLVSLLIIVSAVYGARWKTAAQVEAANASAWEDASRRLEAELEEMRAKMASLDERIVVMQARITELEAMPDVAAVHQALFEHDQKVAEALDRHDANAEKRADRLVMALRETANSQIAAAERREEMA